MESWAIIVVIAIVATTLGNMYRATLKHRSEAGGAHGDELASLRQRVDALEAQLGSRGVIDRLNALVAIVTDSRYELDREIKRLTDPPRQ